VGVVLVGVYSAGVGARWPWTVTVRDPALVEYDGQVDGYDTIGCDLTDPSIDGEPGTWEITLPRSHWAATALEEEGSGVVFRPHGHGAVIASGDWELAEESTDGGRQLVTYSGNVDDDRLSDEVAWPDPTHDLNDTTGNNPVPDAADVRTGPAESVLKAFVTANVGSTGTAVQSGRVWPWLSVPATASRGLTVTLKGQFDPLLDIAQQAAAPTTGITWQIRQQGSGVLQLVVRARVDVSADVVFSHAEGTLGKSSLRRRRPAITQAIASSSGDTARLFARSTDTAAESLWRRRRVSMVDGPSDVIADLTAAAVAAVAGGRERAGLTCEPVVITGGPRFGIDYQLGDYVGAVTATGRTIDDLLTQVSYRHDSGKAPTITPSIGINRVDETDALVPIVRNLVRYARRNQARS
jgi:hypothetical protein